MIGMGLVPCSGHIVLVISCWSMVKMLARSQGLIKGILMGWLMAVDYDD